MPLTRLLTSLGLAYARVPMQRHATDTLLDGMLVLHSSKNTIFAEVRFTDALWHCACVPCACVPWHPTTMPPHAMPTNFSVSHSIFPAQ